MKKRRSLTLIEIAIAMGLGALLMATLFHIQTNLAKSQGQVEKIKQVVMGRQRLRLRLNQIFKANTDFEYKENCLILKYHNGIDCDRKFSGNVLSTIYLEDEKLCLATWRSSDLWRVDVLMEEVKTLSFHFFDNENNAWSDIAHKKNFRLLKLVINQEVFPFFL